GRFRDYVKTALYHLVCDYQRRQRVQVQQLAPEMEPVTAPDPVAAEREFLVYWREELLRRAWEALAVLERETGRSLHTVLLHKVQHPNMTSDVMAREVGKKLGRLLTAPGVRQILHRAREAFADL